jgi:hypothetical protein
MKLRAELQKVPKLRLNESYERPQEVGPLVSF